jgi:excisionase family DNA binding protein
METKNEKIEWLNIQEAAEYLNLKVNTLYNKVHRKTIPYYKYGKLLFKKSDLDEIVNNNAVLTNEKPILSLPVMLIDNEKIVDALINIENQRKIIKDAEICIQKENEIIQVEITKLNKSVVNL